MKVPSVPFQFPTAKYYYGLEEMMTSMFYPKDIRYHYEEYLEHKKQTERFARSHANYILRTSHANAFRNLQIILHEGKWAMISKGNAPAIHFVIHHPKRHNAIEHFVPPVVETAK